MRTAAARFHASSAGSRGASRTAAEPPTAGAEAAGAELVGAALVLALLAAGGVGVGVGAPHADSKAATATDDRVDHQTVKRAGTTAMTASFNEQ
jgi:hypothetical protein